MTGSTITVMLGHTVLASTWPRSVHPELLAALASPVGNPAMSNLSGLTSDLRALQVGGETYLTLTVPLVDGRGQPIGVYMLQQSLDQELAFLHQMQHTLLLTGLVRVIVPNASGEICSDSGETPDRTSPSGSSAGEA
jgi:hypothetical protein